MKQPCVYIVARSVMERSTQALRRACQNGVEHRKLLVKGFSAKYGCKFLVWYEVHETMIEAITREKQIKAAAARRNWL